MTFRETLRQDYERAKHRRYCKCGHSIMFPPTSKVDKKICTYCGRYVYKNNCIEFKEKLLKAMKV